MVSPPLPPPAFTLSGFYSRTKLCFSVMHSCTHTIFMMNLYYPVRLGSLSLPVLKNVVTGQNDVNNLSDADTKWCFIRELNRSPVSCKSRALPSCQHASHFTEFLGNYESYLWSAVVKAQTICGSFFATFLNNFLQMLWIFTAKLKSQMHSTVVHL